jgi:hypothetical protein
LRGLVLRTLLVLVALVLFLVIAVWTFHAVAGTMARRAGASQRAESREFEPRSVERFGSVPDALRESSGLAVSRRHVGVLWSHNDSGDEPRIYAIDFQGNVLATFLVTGARAQDWEGMALGPCPEPGSTDCLYVGDIGDNAERRSNYTIYVVPEPDVGGFRSGDTGRVDAVLQVDYTYPDASHDAEALTVAPDGRVVVLTKGRTGRPQVFEIPLSRVGGGEGTGPVVAEQRARLPIEPDERIGRMVTGAATAPEAHTLAVRTYTEMYFFEWLGDTWRWDAPRRCYLGNLEPLGEAIDFLNDTTVVLTSETRRGRPGGIHVVRCAISGP